MAPASGVSRRAASFATSKCLEELKCGAALTSWAPACAEQVKWTFIHIEPLQAATRCRRAQSSPAKARLTGGDMMHEGKEVHACTLDIGTEVELVDLVNEMHAFNNFTGVVKSWDCGTGLYEVSLYDEAWSFSVSGANLRSTNPPSPSSGSTKPVPVPVLSVADVPLESTVEFPLTPRWEDAPMQLSQDYCGFTSPDSQASTRFDDLEAYASWSPDASMHCSPLFQPAFEPQQLYFMDHVQMDDSSWQQWPADLWEVQCGEEAAADFAGEASPVGAASNAYRPPAPPPKQPPRLTLDLSGCLSAPPPPPPVV
eukprot:TRINITY_DN24548_c0_g1_i2.p1 TRINITY_DN24548_c0_g1~~TRINITY_DN24548_c0_g1_i2.p1  ORF type:complete len:312 (+),score=63.70 TRINITY_DN24548_c0_g1_i2:66-1001(+)